MIIRAHVEELFAEPDRQSAREVLGLWLSGKRRQARRRAQGLSPGGAKRMDAMLDDRQHQRMGDHLLRAVERNAEALSRVSPKGHLGELSVPTYLVHGRDDPVIPSLETLWLAREVPAESLRGVLVTPVLAHMDLNESPSLGQHWQVVRMVTRMLGEQEP